MAFTLIQQKIVASDISAGGLNQNFDLHFQVQSDTLVDIVPVITWLVSNLPGNLTDYGNATAILSTFNATPSEETGSSKTFKGVATYQQKFVSPANDDDLTEESTYISFGSNSYEYVVEKAMLRTGVIVPVMNSAWDKYNPSLMEIERRMVLKIEKTYAWTNINPALFAPYLNSVNSNSTTVVNVPIIARGGLILNISPRVRNKGGGVYDWRISYEIEIRGHGKTYDREVLDQGFYYIEACDAPDNPNDPPDNVFKIGFDWYRRKTISQQSDKTGDYQKSTTPILLNGTGGKLGNRDEPIYRVYRTKPEKNWSSLSLPSSLT